MCLLVSLMLCRGTTRRIVSSRGGCPGICTASWYGTGAPVFSVTPGAIDGRLGLCCCCCTDACSWPTLKGQDIPWFRLAIYCRGCQHLRHSYPAEPGVPLRPPCMPAASPQSELRGAVTWSLWRGRFLFFCVTQKCFPSSSPIGLSDKYLIPSVQYLLRHTGDGT